MQPGITLFKAGDNTGDTPAFYAILCDRQGGGAVEYGRKIYRRVRTRQPHFQLERLRKVFIQGKVGDDKGLWRQTAGGQRKLQAAGRTFAPTPRQLAGFLQGFGGGVLAICRPFGQSLSVAAQHPCGLLSQTGALLPLLKQRLSLLKFRNVLFY
ncbi:hypothetical protein Xvie_03874 [Xenorhabdus vietnamensis]|uniref:Uncharacterized protein n=1 Tax=Xenorhabdus vietnamensis TaxID=351656 RepID=A0A1Y2S8J2_9GAMM|nr:hypothetical protein Xvie_03874 [Xenorhabdus vietnamensis]